MLLLDNQSQLGGFDEAVKSGIECGVTTIIRSIVIRSRPRDLAGGHDPFGKIYVRVNTG